MIMRYQIQPGLFDFVIDNHHNEDPLEKYVRKAEKQFQDEFLSKKYFDIGSKPDDPTGKAGDGMPKPFFITEELKRMQKFKPLEGKFMNEDETLSSMNLVNNYLDALKKDTVTGGAALAFVQEKSVAEKVGGN